MTFSAPSHSPTCNVICSQKATWNKDIFGAHQSCGYWYHTTISQTSNSFLFAPTQINFPQAKSQIIKGSKTEALEKPDAALGSREERHEWGLLLWGDVLPIHSPGIATLTAWSALGIYTAVYTGVEQSWAYFGWQGQNLVKNLHQLLPKLWHLLIITTS